MSQLNFFYTDAEVKDILKEVKSSDDVIIYRGKSFSTEYPEPLQDLDALKDFDTLTLWLKNVYKQPKCSINGGGLLEGQYLFDYLNDPIIEIENCKRINNILLPGRIFYKAGWIENDDLRNEHKRWANKVQRTFNKNKLIIGKVWRVSHSVEQWVHNGGQLELGRNGQLIDKNNINGV